MDKPVPTRISYVIQLGVSSGVATMQVRNDTWATDDTEQSIKVEGSTFKLQLPTHPSPRTKVRYRTSDYTGWESADFHEDVAEFHITYASPFEVTALMVVYSEESFHEHLRRVTAKEKDKE